MTDFECAECGYVSVKWMGRCPSCRQWDCLVEASSYDISEEGGESYISSPAIKLSEVSAESGSRISSGLKGFDRLFGGGFVRGETLLLGGPPGVGKSTLFLQLAGALSKKGKKILYISGEENPAQIKLHSERLSVKGENIRLLANSDLGAAEKEIRKKSPDVIFTDSIQAVALPSETGSPGTIKQVKKSTARLVSIAKNSGALLFISGQITKQGSIAGPKLLEHMVDAVAYIDAIDSELRILNIVKNRFGPCGDFLLYRMGSEGLGEEEDLSAARSGPSPAGEVITCIKSGSRYQTARIQALVSESYFEYPLRRTSGFSRQRLLMLSAIASRHMKLKLAASDIYLNVGGGINISARSADLAVLAALYSNIKGIPPPEKSIFIGETGLAGEVCGVSDMERRLNFAERNGFKIAVVPRKEGMQRQGGLKVISLKDVGGIKNIIKRSGS